MMTIQQTELFKQPISRINVIGTSGIGKSTFCKKLSEVLKYPHLEMDKIFWKQNWQQPSNEEFFEKLESELDQPTWILDGNYTRTVPIKWNNVDLVIWLDYSFSITLPQAICRAAKRAWTKHELWPGTGNKESFRKSFLSKESIIWWTITTHAKVREKYSAYLTDPRFSHIKFVRLQNHAEAEKLIEQLNRIK